MKILIICCYLKKKRGFMLVKFTTEEFVAQKETFSPSGEKIFNFSMVTQNPYMRFIVSSLDCTFPSSAKRLLVEGSVTGQNTTCEKNNNAHHFITYQTVLATKIEPIEEENEN